MLIEYPTRAKLVEALVGYNAQGIDVQVVGLGRTLQVPDHELDDAGEDLIGEAPQEPWDDERMDAFVATATDEELQMALNKGWVTEDQVLDAMARQPTPTLELDPSVQQFVDHSTVEQLQQAVADGHIDKETLLRYETAGKSRKGVLAIASEDD